MNISFTHGQYDVEMKNNEMRNTRYAQSEDVLSSHSKITHDKGMSNGINSEEDVVIKPNSISKQPAQKKYEMKGEYFQCTECDEFTIHKDDPSVCKNDKCQTNVISFYETFYLGKNCPACSRIL